MKTNSQCEMVEHAGASSCSAEDIVLEVRLPIRLKELAAITQALEQIHGKNVLSMRQVGSMLQFCKPRPVSPNHDQGHM
jgi:hypothetical protein